MGLPFRSGAVLGPLLALPLLLAGCSGTPFGEALSRSFPPGAASPSQAPPLSPPRAPPLAPPLLRPVRLLPRIPRALAAAPPPLRRPQPLPPA
ncbi:MAG: hypothetical protein ACK5JJ_04370 [Cyanobacteriota bacterium]